MKNNYPKCRLSIPESDSQESQILTLDLKNPSNLSYLIKIYLDDENEFSRKTQIGPEERIYKKIQIHKNTKREGTTLRIEFYPEKNSTVLNYTCKEGSDPSKDSNSIFYPYKDEKNIPSFDFGCLSENNFLIDSESSSSTYGNQDTNHFLKISSSSSDKEDTKKYLYTEYSPKFESFEEYVIIF